MIRLALILALLATPASAASFVDRAHCWAYPHHARCQPVPLPTPRPVEAPPEPVQAPVVAPPPAPVVIAPAPVASPQPPPRAAPAVVHRKPVKAKPRAKPKPKYKAAPVRQRLTAAKVAGWCAQVPKGTSMGQIEFFASLRGVTLTAAHRRQAAACLNSKGT